LVVRAEMKSILFFLIHPPKVLSRGLSPPPFRAPHNG
jgi:hypothetical protein